MVTSLSLDPHIRFCNLAIFSNADFPLENFLDVVISIVPFLSWPPAGGLFVCDFSGADKMVSLLAVLDRGNLALEFGGAIGVSLVFHRLLDSLVETVQFRRVD